MKEFILLIILIFSGTITFSSAFAHTTVSVGPYDIEVGWGIEPPVVGIRNDFVFEISEPGETEGVKSGVKNAFRDLEAVVKFGGVSKTLDINADVRPGHYFSPVIPTKTGSFIINVKGQINGVSVDVDIPLEDVESTAVLDFPPQTSANQDVSSLKNALSSIQKELTDIKSGTIDQKSTQNLGASYDFAIFGMSLGAAGVILAIISMIKRK